ncbi:hypothetical protein [Nostoc sp.]
MRRQPQHRRPHRQQRGRERVIRHRTLGRFPLLRLAGDDRGSKPHR